MQGFFVCLFVFSLAQNRDLCSSSLSKKKSRVWAQGTTRLWGQWSSQRAQQQPLCKRLRVLERKESWVQSLVLQNTSGWREAQIQDLCWWQSQSCHHPWKIIYAWAGAKNHSEHHCENEDCTHHLCTLLIKTYRYLFKVDQWAGTWSTLGELGKKQPSKKELLNRPPKRGPKRRQESRRRPLPALSKLETGVKSESSWAHHMCSQVWPLHLQSPTQTQSTYGHEMSPRRDVALFLSFLAIYFLSGIQTLSTSLWLSEILFGGVGGV